MDDLARASAIVLAVVFNVASFAKARRTDQTREAFEALGVPGPALAAFVVPVIEVVLAMALIVVPGPAGWAALVLLGLFTIVLWRAIASGSRAPCACFGARRTEPVSVVDVARNVMLAALAVLATGAPGPGWPGVPALVAVTVAAAVGRVVLALLDARRRGTSLWPRVPHA